MLSSISTKSTSKLDYSTNIPIMQKQVKETMCEGVLLCLYGVYGQKLDLPDTVQVYLYCNQWTGCTAHISIKDHLHSNVCLTTLTGICRILTRKVFSLSSTEGGDV